MSISLEEKITVEKLQVEKKRVEAEEKIAVMKEKNKSYQNWPLRNLMVIFKMDRILGCHRSNNSQ